MTNARKKAKLEKQAKARKQKAAAYRARQATAKAEGEPAADAPALERLDLAQGAPGPRVRGVSGAPSKVHRTQSR